MKFSSRADFFAIPRFQYELSASCIRRNRSRIRFLLHHRLQNRPGIARISQRHAVVRASARSTALSVSAVNEFQPSTTPRTVCTGGDETKAQHRIHQIASGTM